MTSARYYEVMACPNCHGTSEAPNCTPCIRCEGFGGVEQCLATQPGQRYEHDRRACSHYGNVGASLLDGEESA